MGLWEDITQYYFNWMVYAYGAGGLAFCFMVGSWGLLWDDDDGEMMNMCFALFDGIKVEYPVKWVSVYAAD